MNITWALSYTLVSLTTAAIIILIYRHVSYDMGSKKEIDTYRAFLLAFLGFILSNGVCVWGNCYSLGILGTVFTAIGLVALCATACFWFYFIEVRLNPSIVEKKKHRLIITLPMLIVVLLTITSPATHLIFYYNDQGIYCRGFLYPIILIMAFLYLATATLQTWRKIGSARTKSQKRQYYYLMMFIVFPFLAGVTDLIHAHLPSMELVVMFGIVLIYLNLQHAQIYRDGLTGLYNRRLTDEYLEESIAFASEEKPVYFFLADIDRFKSINDRFGHVEGDRALKLVAEVMKKYEDSDDCYVSRWGGDEIVVIVDPEKDFDPDEFKNNIAGDIKRAIQAENLEYDITLSFGYVRCTDPDMEVDRIIHLADQRMYGAKALKDQVT